MNTICPECGGCCTVVLQEKQEPVVINLSSVFDCKFKFFEEWSSEPSLREIVIEHYMLAADVKEDEAKGLASQYLDGLASLYTATQNPQPSPGWDEKEPLSKEALDAFQAGFKSQLRERHKHRFSGKQMISADEAGLRAMLKVLRSNPPFGAGVAVKPLDWVEREGVTSTFDASTSIGHYVATITDDGRGMWFIVGLTQSNYMIANIGAGKPAGRACNLDDEEVLVCWQFMIDKALEE